MADQEFTVSNPLGSASEQFKASRVEEEAAKKTGAKKSVFRKAKPSTTVKPEGFTISGGLKLGNPVDVPPIGETEEQRSRRQPVSPEDETRYSELFLTPDMRTGGKRTKTLEQIQDPNTAAGAGARFDVLAYGRPTLGNMEDPARKQFLDEVNGYMRTGEWSSDMLMGMLEQRFGREYSTRLNTEGRHFFDEPLLPRRKTPEELISMTGAVRDVGPMEAMSRVGEELTDIVGAGYSGLDPSSPEFQSYKKTDVGRLITGVSHMAPMFAAPQAAGMAFGAEIGGRLTGNLPGDVLDATPLVFVKQALSPEADWVDKTLGIVGIAAAVYPFAKPATEAVKGEFRARDFARKFQETVPEATRSESLRVGRAGSKVQTYIEKGDFGRLREFMQGIKDDPVFMSAVEKYLRSKDPKGPTTQVSPEVASLPGAAAPETAPTAGTEPTGPAPEGAPQLPSIPPRTPEEIFTALKNDGTVTVRPNEWVGLEAMRGMIQRGEVTTSEGVDGLTITASNPPAATSEEPVATAPAEDTAPVQPETVTTKEPETPVVQPETVTAPVKTEEPEQAPQVTTETPQVKTEDKPAAAQQNPYRTYGASGKTALRKMADEAKLSHDPEPGDSDSLNLVTFFDKHYQDGANGRPFAGSAYHTDKARIAYAAGQQDAAAKKKKEEAKADVDVEDKPKEKEPRLIGKNGQGDDLFEDENGVRSYVRNGVKSTESVAIVPTRAGVKTNPVRGEPKERSEFHTEAEIEAARPKEKPVPAKIEDMTDDDILGSLSDDDDDVKSALETLRTARETGRLDSKVKELKEAAPGGKIDLPGVDDDVVEAMTKIATTLYGKGVTDRARLAGLMKKVAGNVGAMFATMIHPSLEAQSKEKPKDNEDDDARSSEDQPAVAVGGSSTQGQAGPVEADQEGGGSGSGGGVPEVSSGGSGQPVRQPDVTGDKPGESVADGDEPSGGGTGTGGDVAGDERGGSGERGGNFRFRGLDDAAPARSKKDKLTASLAALRALRAAQARGYATAEEQAAIAMFPGWGFDKEILNPKKPQAKTADAKELRALLTKAEYRKAVQSTGFSHFTDPNVVAAVWEAVGRLGYDGKSSVLEPSAGSGLFASLRPEWDDGKSWTLVEPDVVSAGVLASLFPDAKVVDKPLQTAIDGHPEYGLVITNVPFRDKGVTDIGLMRDLDKDAYEALTSNLHNFMIAKSIMATAPGGLTVVITSRYTLDGVAESHKYFRRWAAAQADLLGAVRLPSEAFVAQANTEVVTDLLVFRKKDGTETASAAWLESVDHDVSGTATFRNEVFGTDKGAVLGYEAMDGTMYASGQYNVHGRQGKDLGELLSTKLTEILPEKVFAPKPESRKAKPVEVAPPPHVQLGEVWKDGNDLLRLLPDGTVSKLSLSKADRAVFESYLPLKDALDAVLKANMDGAEDADLAKLQTGLRKAYDAFVSKHGQLHSATVTEKPAKDDEGKPVLDEDGDPVMETTARFKYKKLLFQDTQSVRVFALEVWDTVNSKVEKLSDVFTSRVYKVKQDVQKVDNPYDGLAASLNTKGLVDIGFIAAVSGVSEEEAVAALKGLVFKDPVTQEYVSADDYLSGNVVVKLEAAKEAGEAYEDNVTALEAVQPEPRAYEDIYIYMGAPWMPVKAVEAFVEREMGWDVTVQHAGSHWKIDSRSGPQGPASAQAWATSRKTAKDILGAALEGRSLPVYDKTESGSVLNQAETDAANEAVSRVREAYTAFLDQDASLQQEVADAYNRDVNCFVVRNVDGSMLTFDGLSPVVDRREHAYNAVWRAMRDKFSLWWHGVGAGKTYASAMLAMKLKQTGLRNKPMVVVYKPTLEQIIGDYYKAYPNANILAAHQDSFSADNRDEFLALAAAGNWDAVIVTQEQFNSLSMSPDSVDRFFEAQIDRVLSDAGMSQDEGEKAKRSRDASVREIGRAIASLEETWMKERAKAEGMVYDKQQERFVPGKRPPSVTFEMLGIDHLIVDEAHMYKGLPVPTRMQNMNTSVSARAQTLQMKLDHVRGIGGGATLMTGTALVNSASEVHVWMRYLMPDELAAQGLNDFDSFVATFGVPESKVEMSTSGKFVAKDRIRAFRNIEELATLFTQISDIVPTESIKEIKLPYLMDREGNRTNAPIIVVNQATEMQKLLLIKLAEKFKNLPKRPGPGEDNHLSLSTEGRKISQDARLVDPTIPAEEGSKIQGLADEIAAIYKKTEAQKSTQIAFVDIGVPGKHQVFDMYDELTSLLVKRGVKRAEIARISDAKTVDDRLKIAARMRSGDIRVLIGSRPKLGVGMNVQHKLIAVHHMMLGWNPAMVEQGNGRIIRFANENPGVMVFYYVTKGTFDQVTAERTMSKGNVFTQFMRALAGKAQGFKEIDDLDDAEGALSMAEVVVGATGDERLMLLVQADIEWRKSQAVYQSDERRKTTARANHALLTDTEIPREERRLTVLAKLKKFLGEEPLALTGDPEKPSEVWDAIAEKLATKVERSETETVIANMGDVSFVTGSRFMSVKYTQGQGAFFRYIAAVSPEGRSYLAVYRAGAPTSETVEQWDWVKGENAALMVRQTPSGASVSGIVHSYTHVDDAIGRIEAGIERMKTDAASYARTAQAPNLSSARLAAAARATRRLEFETNVTMEDLNRGDVGGFDYQRLGWRTLDKPQKVRTPLGDAVVVDVNDKGWMWARLDDGREGYVSPRDGDDYLSVADQAGVDVPAENAQRAQYAREEAQRDMRKVEERKLRFDDPVSASRRPLNEQKRIQVDPIKGKGTKKLSEIMIDVKKSFPRTATGTAGKGALGSYLPAPRYQFIRATTNLRTVAHELGHLIDDRFLLFAEWKGDDKTPFDDELGSEWFQSTVTEGLAPWHVRAEQFAEFVLAWLVNPSEASQVAPKLTAHVVSKVPKATLEAMRSFGDDMRRFAGAEASEQVAAGFKATELKDRGVLTEALQKVKDAFEFLTPDKDEDGDWHTGFWDTVRRYLTTDSMAPFVSATREAMNRKGVIVGQGNDLMREGLRERNNPYSYLRWLAYADHTAKAAVEKGVRSIDHAVSDPEGKLGPSLAEVLGYLDTRTQEAFDKDRDDLFAYMYAQRHLHEREKLLDRADEKADAFAKALDDRVEEQLDAYNAELTTWGAVIQALRRQTIADKANEQVRLIETRVSDLAARQKAVRRVLDTATKAQAESDKKVAAALDKMFERRAKKLRKRADARAAKYRERAKKIAQARSENLGLVNTGGGLITAYGAAKQTLAAIAQDEARQGRIVEAAEGYRQIGRAVVEILRQGGLLTDEDAMDIVTDHPYWISASRAEDEDGPNYVKSVRSLASHDKVIRKFKGSSKMKEDPVGALLTNVYRATVEALKNRTLENFTGLMGTERGFYEEGYDTGDLAVQLPEGAPPTDSTIVVFRRGVKELWHIPDKVLYETVSQGIQNPRSPHPVTQAVIWLFGAPSRLIRWGVTQSPIFAFRNWGHDTMTRAVISEAPLSVRDVSAFVDKTVMHAYEHYGIGLSRMERDGSAAGWRKVQRKAMKEAMEAGHTVVWRTKTGRVVLKFKVKTGFLARAKGVVTGIGQTYEEALMRAETFNRAAEYKAAYRYAKDVLKRNDRDAELFAQAAARDVMTDFRRSSVLSKFMNQFIPFYNAAWQGQSSYWNNFGKHKGRNFARLMVLTALVIGVSRVIGLITGTDKERRRRPQSQSLMFFQIPAGPGRFVLVPKGRENGVFVSVVENALDYMTGDPNAWEDFLPSAFATMSPINDEADVLGGWKTAIEISANRDLRYDKPIVPEWEDKLELADRKGTVRASEAGQALGKVLNQDPRIVDHAVEGWLGYVGRMVTSGSDLLARKPSGIRKAPEAIGLYPEPMFGNRDVQYVMKEAEKAGMRKSALEEWPDYDAYFKETDPVKRFAQARSTIDRAQELRDSLQSATKGLTGEERKNAVKAVLSPPTSKGAAGVKRSVMRKRAKPAGVR